MGEVEVLPVAGDLLEIRQISWGEYLGLGILLSTLF